MQYSSMKEVHTPNTHLLNKGTATQSATKAFVL